MATVAPRRGVDEVPSLSENIQYGPRPLFRQPSTDALNGLTARPWDAPDQAQKLALARKTKRITKLILDKKKTSATHKPTKQNEH